MNAKSLSTSRPSSQQGFTLIELLTVIAIIGVLAAILIPSLSKVRAHSYKAKSLSNLRSLQVANGLYATSNNGFYVSPSLREANSDGSPQGSVRRWFTVTEYLDFLRGALAEDASSAALRSYPEELLDPVAQQSESSFADSAVGSYGAFGNDPSNGSWQDAHNSANHSLRLKEPSKTAAFATGVDWRLTYGGRLSWSGEEKKLGGAMAYRHANAALVVFFDGHVAEVTKEDMVKIDEEDGILNPFWTGQ